MLEDPGRRYTEASHGESVSYNNESISNNERSLEVEPSKPVLTESQNAQYEYYKRQQAEVYQNPQVANISNSEPARAPKEK